MLKATSSIVNVSQIIGVLPVVNGGTGVTTSTGTGSTVLSAAPTLSGNVTLSTGNLIVASGQGIDFSATPGTGTSELLSDYEEGTWTPTVSTSGGNFTSFTSSGRYTKTGRVVNLTFVYAVTNGVGGSGFVTVANLPFAAGGTTEIGGAKEINLTGLPGYINFFSTTVLVVQSLTNSYFGTTDFIVNGSITYIA